MKTKMNFFVTALVVLFTLFASEKANAQTFVKKTLLDIPHNKNLCMQGDTMTVAVIDLENVTDTNSYLQAILLDNIPLDSNTIESMYIYIDNSTVFKMNKNDTSFTNSSKDNFSFIFFAHPLYSWNGMKIPPHGKTSIRVVVSIKNTFIGSKRFTSRLIVPTSSINADTMVVEFPTNWYLVDTINIVDCLAPMVSIQKNWQPDTACINAIFWPDFNITRNNSQIVKFEWSLNNNPFYSCVNCSGYLSKYMQIKEGWNKIQITITDQENRTGSDSIFIYGIPLPHPIITVTKNTVCKNNDEVVMECKSTAGLSKWGFAYNYPPTPDAPKIFHAFDAGSYGFSAVGLNGCWFDTSIFINGLPSPQTPRVLVHDRVLVCTILADSFLWCSGPKATPMESSQNSPSMPITQADWYSVIVFNKYGCSEHSETIWGDYSMTGISEMKAENTSVYPNPFTDKINIESEVGSSFVIIDINGKNVYEGTSTSQNEQISINTPPGIYTLTISKDDKKVHHRIVKI